jgi:hypothetical protein
VDGYKVRDEPIAFVFDQQKQFEGRAKDLYERLSRRNWPRGTDRKWPLAYRLGSIGFESRLRHVELQAADAWAYESRKYISESVLRDYPIRWQMQMFMDSGRFNISGYQKEQILGVATAIEACNS